MRLLELKTVTQSVMLKSSVQITKGRNLRKHKGFLNYRFQTDKRPKLKLCGSEVSHQLTLIMAQGSIHYTLSQPRDELSYTVIQVNLCKSRDRERSQNQK